MKPAIVIEQFDRKNKRNIKRKVKIIGLGNVGFWAFAGFVTGYLLAALVAAPIWNR